MKDKNTRDLANLFNKMRPLLIDGETDEAMKLLRESFESLSMGVSLKSIDILRDTSRYDAFVERTKDFDRFFYLNWIQRT